MNCLEKKIKNLYKKKKKMETNKSDISGFDFQKYYFFIYFSYFLDKVDEEYKIGWKEINESKFKKL